jgi:C4-dicarboxylate-specific signal transduction histidine kinase
LVVAAATLMLVTGWALVHVQSKRERNLAIEAAQQKSLSSAIALEQYVARTLEGADLVTRHLADVYLRSGKLHAFRRPTVPVIVKDVVPSGSTYGSLSVISPAGDVLATSDPRASKPVNISRTSSFRLQARHAGQELVIGPPDDTRKPGEAFIHLTRRVLDAKGRTLGFVEVQIRPRDLSSFNETLRFDPTDLISVIGLDGITRVRREGNLISYGQDLSGRLVMQMQMRHPNGSYLGPSSLDGHVRYFSHRRLARYPIFVTAGTSEAVALDPVNQRSAIYKSIMALVTVVSVLLVLIILSQVRQRNAHASSLSAANARLRAAQRIAKVGDWTYDPTSRSLLWSDELCTMYERDVTRDEFQMEEYLEYLDQDGREAVDEMLALVLESGAPQSCEVKATLPSGLVKDRQLTANPIGFENGIVSSIVGTDQDITAEKLVQTLQEQVNKLSRVDAMNIMASTLAHELMQPLTAASNYLAASKVFLGRSESSSRIMAMNAVASAQSSTDTAVNIIGRARAMTRMERRRREPFELARLLAETADALVREKVCSAQWIKSDIASDADLLWGDRVQVQQVLTNVLKNACEAAAPQKRPVVKLRASRRADGFVEIRVSDNGGGVQFKDDIFSPLRSTKSAGLGLGLSISRTIVEYHGGRIWLEDTSSSGTTIVFTVSAEPHDRQ